MRKKPLGCMDSLYTRIENAVVVPILPATDAGRMGYSTFRELPAYRKGE